MDALDLINRLGKTLPGATMYQQHKVEIDIELIDGEDCIMAKSDRIVAVFENRDDLAAFAQRSRKFLAKIHNPLHANNAGFLFMLAPDFFMDGCESNQLAVYLDALKIVNDGGEEPYILLGDKLTNDDIADASFLMTRQWIISAEMDFSILDGTWETFRAFFMANSQDPAEFKIEIAS
jgi:hypothetical protein